MEFINMFLKAHVFALCGQVWWRKPKNLGKTTYLGWGTTNLPHDLPDRGGDKRVHYPLHFPGPWIQ